MDSSAYPTESEPLEIQLQQCHTLISIQVDAHDTLPRATRLRGCDLRELRSTLHVILQEHKSLLNAPVRQAFRPSNSSNRVVKLKKAKLQAEGS